MVPHELKILRRHCSILYLQCLHKNNTVCFVFLLIIIIIIGLFNPWNSQTFGSFILNSQTSWNRSKRIQPRCNICQLNTVYLFTVPYIVKTICLALFRMRIYEMFTIPINTAYYRYTVSVTILTYCQYILHSYSSKLTLILLEVNSI